MTRVFVEDPLGPDPQTRGPILNQTYLVVLLNQDWLAHLFFGVPFEGVGSIPLRCHSRYLSSAAEGASRGGVLWFLIWIVRWWGRV